MIVQWDLAGSGVPGVATGNTSARGSGTLFVALKDTNRELLAQILDDLKKIEATKYIPGEDIASVCVALGDKEEAFMWLERAYTEHSGPIHSIATRREFRPLHSDPRFAAILKRIGLDPEKVLVSEKQP